MRIVIFGYGYVGQAHESVLAQRNTVRVFDPKFWHHKLNDDRYDCAIICVATPESLSGSCDMTNVYNVLDQCDPTKPILIKSTISIEGWNTIKKCYPDYDICFSPEFLREKTYMQDFSNAPIIYIGGDNFSFWNDLFGEVLPHATNVHLSAEQAILTKYFRNSFLATKVAFFNQMYDLCEKVGVDYEIVRGCVAADDRIGSSHTRVTKERGFGGSCFPKDTKALMHTANNHDTELNILQSAIEYNSKIRK